VAAARQNESDLNRVRARVAVMPIQSLVCMQWASQMSGVELEDADRAMAEILRRSPGRWERRRVLFDANVLAQNRGRPHESARLWSETRQLLHGSRPDAVWERLITFGVFGGGDTSAARVAAAEAATAAAEDLRAPISSTASRSTIARRLYNIFIWKLAHDDTDGIRPMIPRVRRDYRPVEASMLDADLAVVAGDSNAREKLRVLDSLALLGCCEARSGAMLAARLHERLGDREGALRMVRAAPWQFAPANLATALHEEGRLAEAAGDYDGARRAYAQYLSLRSRPEPEVEREVSAVRAELARITKH
jgi:tetratricopeptide (TPR) repeat protein